jgi:hypothetical protein
MFLLCSISHSVLALAAIIATHCGSLIDSPKPELGERNCRLRGKDEQIAGVFRA